jgi:hypothetical protein
LLVLREDVRGEGLDIQVGGHPPDVHADKAAAHDGDHHAGSGMGDRELQLAAGEPGLAVIGAANGAGPVEGEPVRRAVQMGRQHEPGEGGADGEAVPVLGSDEPGAAGALGGPEEPVVGRAGVRGPCPPDLAAARLERRRRRVAGSFANRLAAVGIQLGHQADNASAHPGRGISAPRGEPW